MAATARPRSSAASTAERTSSVSPEYDDAITKARPVAAGGRPYPRCTTTGTGSRSPAHAATMSAPAAEPPMPARTTTGGASTAGAGAGRRPAAVRHWCGNAASTWRTSWGSARLRIARSSSRPAPLLTVHVPVNDRGREPLALEEAAQLLDEAHGAMAAPRTAHGDREMRLAFPLIRGQEKHEQLLEPPQQLAALLVL